MGDYDTGQDQGGTPGEDEGGKPGWDKQQQQDGGKVDKDQDQGGFGKPGQQQ